MEEQTRRENEATEEQSNENSNSPDTELDTYSDEELLEDGIPETIEEWEVPDMTVRYHMQGTGDA